MAEFDLKASQKRADLRRMRLIATGLAILMLATFLAARRWHDLWPGLSYVEAFAEAALVGAVADWFAVTALFRHPFGLPIPHTAIIPRNKARIGESLGRFISNNFLAPREILDRLKKLDPAAWAGRWLSDPQNADFLAERISSALPAVLTAMDDSELRLIVRDAVSHRLQGIQAASLLARILRVLVAQGRHQALFDQIIDAAGSFLVKNRDEVRSTIKAKSAWWVPKWVDDKVFARIVAGLEETLLEMRHPDHPWRSQFSLAVEDFCDKLERDADYIAKADRMKREFLSNPAVQGYLGGLWGDARDAALRDVRSEDSGIRRALAGALLGLGSKLEKDSAVQRLVNRWVEWVFVHYAVPQRDSIGRFIAEVVDRWDTPTLVNRLELQVGKDLQYIRINGTVVGGAVGLLIHAATQVVS